MKKPIIPIFFFVLLCLSTIPLISAYDSPVTYTGVNYQVYENIHLVGNGTGTGLTVTGSSHNAFYNVHIENFSIGIDVNGGLVNNFYNVQVIANLNGGVILENDYGVNRFYGGSIASNGGVGVEIRSGSIMNQFYGTELEVNNASEIKFSGDTYGNLFQGCYFERTALNADPFIIWDNSLGSNTFYSNKFATQGDATLEINGDTNVFKDNIFDSGTVTFTVSGDGNTFRDNRQGLANATVTLTDSGTNTVFQNNFFVDDTENAGSTPAFLLSGTMQELIGLVIAIAVLSVLVGAVSKRRRPF